MNSFDHIHHRLTEAQQLIQKIADDQELQGEIAEIISAVTAAFRNGNKLFFCGNGGSAADAQHLAAELSGRFYLNRPALDAEALHVNTSYLTAVANDFGYEEVFARLIDGKGKSGDVLIAISTSGNSTNIVKAVEAAKKKDMVVVGFSGGAGGAMRGFCNHFIVIPSTDTPRVQEAHLLIGHIICEQVEKNLFGKD